MSIRTNVTMWALTGDVYAASSRLPSYGDYAADDAAAWWRARYQRAANPMPSRPCLAQGWFAFWNSLPVGLSWADVLYWSGGLL